nr:LOW QUALITY PROTEIN: putative UPF0607 protein ENSP00000381514 [Microcebus murinus]
MGRKVTLLHLPSVQAVRAPKLIPSSHSPLPCQKENEVKAQEEARKVMAQEEVQADLLETPGQEDRKRGPPSNGEVPSTAKPLETLGGLTSWECSPGPSLQGHLHPNLFKNNWREEGQISPMTSFSEGHTVTSSHSPAKGILHLGLPDPYAAVLPDPAHSCSQILLASLG